MLKIFFAFLLLLAGIALGPLLAGHQGYVLIETENLDIETSVTGLAIIFIITLISILAVEWLLRHLLTTGVRTRGWFKGRKYLRARQQTQAALIKLAEGDYTQVEKMLSRYADYAEQPVANYLLAAEAAQHRGDQIRANQHLERASELAGNNQLPIEITRIRMQLSRNENNAARHGADKLLEVAPRHPEVLRLAGQAYARTEAWSSLLEILPAMENAGVAGHDHREKLQKQAFLGLINQAMADGGSQGVKQWWHKQRRKTRHDVSLLAAVAEQLVICGDFQAAQELILEGLKRHYDERLILLIPRLKNIDFVHIEKVLRHHIKRNDSPSLIYSTLGQLLLRQGKWQEASEALREALKQRPDPYDFAWLADTLDHLSQPEEAARMRRDGLLLTLKNTS